MPRPRRRAAPDLASSGQPTQERIALIAAADHDVVIDLALHVDPRYSRSDERAAAAMNRDDTISREARQGVGTWARAYAIHPVSGSRFHGRFSDASVRS